MAKQKKPQVLEDNFLFSWYVHDHENNRNVIASIGIDGNIYIDGRALRTRTNPGESEESEKAKS